MRFPGSWLRDGLLVVLAAATVAGAGYVVTRDPSPPSTTAQQPLPSPSPSPTAAPTAALVIGSDPTTEVVAAGLESELGWRTEARVLPDAGYNTGAQTYADLIPALVATANADVVLILSSTQPTEEAEPPRLGGNAQFVIAAVRDALPESRIVLVGPVSADPEAFRVQRSVLTGAAARFGAVFVDPIGGGYAEGEVPERLAADLRRVLPPTLLPSPTPTT